MGDSPLGARTHFPFAYPQPTLDSLLHIGTKVQRSNVERSDELSRMSALVMAKLDTMILSARKREGDRPIFDQMAQDLADTVREIADDQVLVALLLSLYRH